MSDARERIVLNVTQKNGCNPVGCGCLIMLALLVLMVVVLAL